MGGETTISTFASFLFLVQHDPVPSSSLSSSAGGRVTTTTLAPPRPFHSMLDLALSSKSSLPLSVRFHFPPALRWARMPKRAPPVASNSSSSVYVLWGTTAAVVDCDGSSRVFLLLDFFFFSFLRFSPFPSSSSSSSFLSMFFRRCRSCNLASVPPTLSFHQTFPSSLATSFSLPNPRSSSLFRILTWERIPSLFLPSPVPSVHPIFSNCRFAKLWEEGRRRGV
mmetsp:Transcript_30610/g.73910  ORF Transcript_30610/g.73910 Transcript_30610/m.73910 type:complete len:224 (+) Transcript_30610:299-970(+)